MPNSDTERKRKARHVGGSAPRRPRLSPLPQSSPVATRNIAKYPGLCDRCARLDLDTIFSSRRNHARLDSVATLSAVYTWSPASCSFCRLMSQAFNLGLRPNYKPQLVSHSTERLFDSGWSSIGNKTLLTLSGEARACLVQQAADKKGPIRRLKHNEIDFSILRGWVTMCQQWHTKTCVAAVLSATMVPFFKLIDCETRKIIPGPNEPYVALSYLWGTVNPPKSPVVGHLPDNLPKTMEDSISVTHKLGFRYLWIDAYCIDQDREDEKAAQIPKMDLIYQNATVTIIACAGNDSHYGLPGVGSRHRVPQAEALVGKHIIISALADPRTFVANSKWGTRAWTYQEGILSRRRLVFTDEQAYFECNGMYCCESMDLSLEDLHTTNHQSFKKIFWQSDSIGYFPLATGRSQWEVIERIQEYAIRSSNLTDPSDILRGILGILNALSRGNLELHHHQGIPLLQQRSKVGRVLQTIWTPSMSFFSGLCWNLKRESSRRQGFPSWSWTGWHNPEVQWGYDEYEWDRIKVDGDVTVLVKTTTGELANLGDFCQLQAKPQSTLSLTNFVQITAWVSSMRIKKKKSWSGESKYEFEAKIQLEDGGRVYWTFRPTSATEILPMQEVLGIHLAYQNLSTQYTEATESALLVVRKIGAVYERLGFGWVTQFTSKRFDKTGKKFYHIDGDNDDDGPLMYNPIHLKPLGLVRSLKTVTLG